MSILLIGGNGFVGRKLARDLLKSGNNVVCYSEGPPHEVVEGIHYVTGDINEFGTLLQTMKKFKVRKVIHNAAISHPKLFRDNPYKIFKINTVGTLHALEASRLFDVERFVYISSGAVYGNVDKNIVVEEERLYGANPYGASKIASEEMVRNYGIPSAILRPAFIYGPGRRMDCPIREILTNAILQQPTNWEKGLDQRLDFIYIDDLVNAIIQATVSEGIVNSVYNVGGGGGVKFSEIADIVRQLYPNSMINIGTGDLGYDNLGALDIRKAEEDLKWRPMVRLSDGIKEYATWLERVIYNEK